MDVAPYQSVGVLYFGMTPEQVEAALGSPVARMKNFLHEPKFIYNGFNVEFNDNGMAEVTVTFRHPIALQGELLANTKLGVDTLKSKSREKYRGQGVIVLLDLGIAISDDQSSPYPLTAFARGRMDSLLPRFERI